MIYMIIIIIFPPSVEDCWPRASVYYCSHRSSGWRNPPEIFSNVHNYIVLLPPSPRLTLNNVLCTHFCGCQKENICNLWCHRFIIPWVQAVEILQKKSFLPGSPEQTSKLKFDICYNRHPSMEQQTQSVKCVKEITPWSRGSLSDC